MPNIPHFINFSFMVAALPGILHNRLTTYFPLYPTHLALYEFRIRDFLWLDGAQVAVVSCQLQPKFANTPYAHFVGDLYIRTEGEEVLRFRGAIQGAKAITTVDMSMNIQQINVQLDQRYGFVGKNLLPQTVTCNVQLLLQDSTLVIPMQMSGTLFFYEYGRKARASSSDYTEVTQQMNDLQRFSTAAYDPQYWQRSPVILRTPLQRAVLRSLERLQAKGNLVPAAPPK